MCYSNNMKAPAAEPGVEVSEEQNQVQESEPSRVVVQPEPEKTLLTWKAPARLFKKRNREYYSTIAVIVVLLCVILLFAKEFLLIAVILSLAFVAYVLASVAPSEVEHKITNKGIRTGERFYLWSMLGRFWFEDKWGQEMLLVENLSGFPGRLTFLLAVEIKKEELEKILSARIVKEKPALTAIDKAAKWLQEKVPLDS
ncbi:hypothetical protein A2783_05650 [Microgenomates group bacterium RIFCSPHIGHO2_01_FULL_45_11]|nr:MAG: hypothetical protein A2783_05650 [Microgenomates group bacterium RIFCSPHIGHO2_01_FULL_45_11]